MTNASYILKYPKVEDIKPNSYSDLCVMKSAAGYYVGTYYRDDAYGEPWLCPGSRDSEYFTTGEQAESHLNYINPKSDWEQYHRAQEDGIVYGGIDQEDASHLIASDLGSPVIL